ncbi:MAG: TonB-dependent receptor domain-containing protein, partial [Terriglobia bacterium]
WVYNLWEYGDDMTFVKDRHTFKWGGVLRRIQNNNVVASETRGQYTFPSFERLLLGQPDLFGGVPIGEEGYKGIRQTMLAAYFQDDFRATPRLTLNLGLRWETTTDPTESNNQVSNLLDANFPKETVYPEIDAFFKTLDKNFQPRFGFAYQMNDRATRVLRGGVGIYHDLLVPFAFNQQTSKYPPFFHRLRIRDNAGPIPFPNAVSLLSVANAAAVQMEPIWPEMPAGTKYNFNLALQQQWGQRGVFEIAYVGSQARHITRYFNLNYPNYEIIDGEKWYPARGTTSANCLQSSSPANACFGTSITRRNPNWDRMRTKSNDSNSHYNGLQMKLQRQLSSGAQFMVAYTFSKVLDQQGGLNNADNGQRDGSTSLDPDDSAREWGRAGHDATHVMSTNFTYPLPFQFSSGAVNALLGGWEISGLSLVMSGQPMTPQLQLDFSRTGNSGAADRPDLAVGGNLNPIIGTAERWYDPT